MHSFRVRLFCLLPLNRAADPSQPSWKHHLELESRWWAGVVSRFVEVVGVGVLTWSRRKLLHTTVARLGSERCGLPQELLRGGSRLPVLIVQLRNEIEVILKDLVLANITEVAGWLRVIDDGGQSLITEGSPFCIVCPIVVWMN